MRVIVDGVFNHTGRDFFAFADLRKNQEKSPYVDWYIVQHFDNPETQPNEFRYKGWWGNDTLPEFSDAEGGTDLHPGPKQYVMDITRRWMDPDGDGDPQDGIDGWRLDVANEVPPKFWQDWHAVVRQANPQAYTVGEFWDNAVEHLTGGGFSATMNYHAFAFLTKGFLIDGRLSAHDFGRELSLRRQGYPAAMQFALQNLIDSHDTDRVASMIVNRPGDEPYRQAERYDYDVTDRVTPRHDPHYEVRKPNERERRIQRMVVLLQMTHLGAPMVYYGDEAGMWGGDDPCDRLPMVWEDLTYDDQAGDPLGRQRPVDKVAFDAALFEFYRDAIALRRDHEALRRGSWSPAASDDEAQFFAFQRRLGDKTVYIALNRGEQDFTWKLPPHPGSPVEVALTTDEGVEVRRGSNAVEVIIPALTGVALTGR
jgi:glycosidase